MSAFRPSFRLLASQRIGQSTVAPAARRSASSTATLPHAWTPPHYSLKERITKFVPTEAYPLIAAVAAMSSYAIYHAVHAFDRPAGELRLTPARYGRKNEVAPWEDERAMQGKW